MYTRSKILLIPSSRDLTSFGGRNSVAPTFRLGNLYRDFIGDSSEIMLSFFPLIEHFRCVAFKGSVRRAILLLKVCALF